MGDSENILLNGTGTPYISIFDSKGNPIIDPVSGLPIGDLVTSFTYVYDEEREDNGNIHIICNNPDLISLSALGYQMGLRLQWGWVLSESSIFCGPVRKVIIIGVKVEFTSNGVEIDLDIADSSIMLKNTPSNYYKNNSEAYLFSEYVKCLVSGLPNDQSFTINDYKSQDVIEVKKFYKVVDPSQVADYETVSKSGVVGRNYVLGNGRKGINSDYPIYKFLEQKESVNYQDYIPVVLFEINPNISEEERKKLYNRMDEMIKLFPNKYGYINIQQKYNFSRILKGTSKNIWSQFHDLINNIPNGPYYMDGRDGKLEIHNRKYNRPISKIYTYYGGNGELLHFSVESKFIKKTVSVTKGSEVSPEDKTIKTKSEQAVNTPESVLYLKKEYEDSLVPMQTYSTIGMGYYFNAYDTYTGSLIQNNNSAKDVVQEPNGKLRGDYINPYKNIPHYNSVDEGTSKSRDTVVFTQKELQDFVTELKANFKTKLEHKNGLNENASEKSISDILHGVVDKMPYLQVKRQFLVRSDNYRAPDINSGGGGIDYVREWEYSGKNRDLILSNDEPYGLKLIQMGIPQFEENNKQVLYDLYEITFQVDGLKAINQGALDSGVAMGNDLENSTTNQITASATVLGDPTIESSMNFIIQNVSSLYSGKWYSKKVTHNITQGSGYTCDIEFVQENKLLNRVVVSSEVSTHNFLKNIKSDISKWSKNWTEDQVRNMSVSEGLEASVEKVSEDNPDKNIIGEVNPDGSISVTVDTSEASIQYDYPTKQIDSENDFMINSLF
jgi:hypothetical protein